MMAIPCTTVTFLEECRDAISFNEAQYDDSKAGEPTDNQEMQGNVTKAAVEEENYPKTDL